MAGPTFSPEDDLDVERMNLLKQTMQRSSSDPWDNAAGVYDRIQAKRKMSEVEAQIRERITARNQMLQESLKDEDPVVRAAMQSPDPTTRQKVMDYMIKKRERQDADRQWREMTGQGQPVAPASALPGVSSYINPPVEGQPPAAPPQGARSLTLDQVVALQQHSDPEIQRKAKLYHETYFKGIDPKKAYVPFQGGGGGNLPGAMAALNDIGAVEDQSKVFPFKVGMDDIQMPLSQARDQGIVAPRSALGGAVAASSGAGVTPVARPPAAPVPQPPNAVSGALPSAVLAADAGGPFEATMGPDGQLAYQRGGPKGSGARSNPADRKGAETYAVDEAKKRSDENDTYVKNARTIEEIKQLEEIAKKAPTGAAKMGYEAYDAVSGIWGGKGSAKGAAAQNYDARAQTLAAGILKQYGTNNPSNIDLKAAQSRVAAGAFATPEGKAEVLGHLRRALEWEQAQLREKQPRTPIVDPTEAPGQSRAPGVKTSMRDENDPYWNQTAQADPPNLSDANVDSNPYTDFQVGRGRAAGFKDAQANWLIGLESALPNAIRSKENVETRGKDWVNEKQRQKDRGEQEAGYNEGNMLGNFVNPSIAIPGRLPAKVGASVLSKALASIGPNAASGFIQPAEDEAERFVNSTFSGALGGIINKAADLALPATKIGVKQIGSELEKLANDLGIPVSKIQAAPDTIEAAIGRYLHGDNATHLEQAESATKTLLKNRGMKEERIGPDALQKQTNLGQLAQVAMDDLRRIWMAGEGAQAGQAAGTVAPSAYAKFANRHPDSPNTDVDQIAALFQALGTRNFHDNQSVKDLISPVYNTLINNKSIINSSPAIKALVEQIRSIAAIPFRESTESGRQRE